jgi:hypothetical protein
LGVIGFNWVKKVDWVVGTAAVDCGCGGLKILSKGEARNCGANPRKSVETRTVMHRDHEYYRK